MKQLSSRVQHSIGLQAIALAASTGAAQIIMAVLFVFTARSSAPSELGLLVTAIAIGTTSVGLLDFGTNSYWIREVAANRLTPSILGQRAASKILYSFAGLTAWTTLTFWLLPFMTLWISGPLAMSIILNHSCQVPLRGLGRADLAAVVVLADKVLAAALFFILLPAGISSPTALWVSLSVGGALSALIAWSLTPRHNRPPLTIRRPTNPWSGSRHYGLTTVAITAQSMDVPMLTLFAGTNATGIYAAVSRWTQPMALFASAFSSASAPHIAKASNARDAWRTARKSSWLLGAAIGLSVSTGIFAPFIVDTLIGPNYPGSAAVLRILAAGAVVSIINQPLCVFLQARGFDKPIAAITISSALVQLGLVALLSGSMGASGAAVAVLSTQLFLLISLICLLFIKREEIQSGNTVMEMDGSKAG